MKKKHHNTKRSRRLPQTRVSCQAHFTQELTARIQEFLYQFYAQVFLRAESSQQGITPETFVAELAKMDESEAKKLFHEICDPELRCPRCGVIHGTLENFTRNFSHIFKDTTDHMDFQRIKEIAQREKDKRDGNPRTTMLPPFGWRLDPTGKQRLLVYEPEAELIRTAFTLAERGASPEEIAALFNAAGVPAEGQERAAPEYMDHFLNFMRWDDVQIEPIIERDVFSRVQEKLR